MRKDVKLGFTIGGVLLAVLIVYVLVISSGPARKSEVSLAKPELTPVQDGAQTAPGSPAADAGKPVAGDAATIDPFQAGGTERPTGTGARGDDNKDKWSLALQTGKVPLLMTETPAPQDKSANAAAPPANSAANGAAPNGTASNAAGPSGAPASGGATDITGTASSAAPGTPRDPNQPAPSTGGGETLAAQILGSLPATQPATASPGGAKRTHVVQRGESFTTIAAAAYGNGAYYPHLIRANPNIDPKKLRPGMTIVIPDPAEVVANGSNSRAAAAAPAAESMTVPGNAPGTGASVGIDQQTQYRVQPSDSLYKISVKLYGKADRVDKLYELNREAIGTNPAHLKVGMILKLPDPPTSSAAGR